MRLVKTKDFYKTFFYKNGKPSEYTKISYFFNNNDDFYNGSSNEQSSSKKHIVYFNTLFPKYLTAKISKQSRFKLKKLQQNNLDGYGVLIDSEKDKDIESFLLNNFKSSTRSPIKRKKKRLENSFLLNDTFFYGNNILENEYNTIMLALKDMLIRRFNQRNDLNEALSKWEYYNENTYKQIINNEASLYVIYANTDIIAISLNYHAKKVFKGHLLSYDIDYSKFGMGKIIIYNLIDWCIKNKYSILDMGNGEMEYKNIWSNFSYNYEYHFIYKKKEIKAFIIAHSLILKIRMKNLLKALKLVEVFKKLKTTFLKKTISQSGIQVQFNIDSIQMDRLDAEVLRKIDFSDKAHKNLKKTICDFLYISKEHINDIEVFSTRNTSYIIKGKNNIISVTEKS